MPAKRHHLVPQLYLRRWADSRDQVGMFDLKEGKPFPTNIINAVVQSNYYSVETDDDSPTDIVESHLAEIEGYCATGFDAIDGGQWPLDAGSRNALAHFIALQIVRGEHFRSSVNSVTDQLARMTSQMLAAHPEALRAKIRQATGRELTDEDLESQAEFMANGAYTVEASRNFVVETFLELAAKAVEPVMACSWDLLTAPGTEAFLTSDEPIRMWRPPSATLGWMGTGLLTAEDVTLPLDPRRCLRFSVRDGKADRMFRLNARQVAVVNGRTAAGAYRFLISKLGVSSPVGPSDEPLGLPAHGLADSDGR